MVDEKQEGSDRIELRDCSHIIRKDGSKLTTKEFNLARAGWLYLLAEEPDQK